MSVTAQVGTPPFIHHLMTNSKTDKMVIRQQIRKKRSALPDYQQKIASAALSEQVLDKISEVHQAGRTAFYLSQDGEIDLGPLMIHCYKQGSLCFLPVLDRAREYELKFAEWTPGSAMSKNKYGIAEPVVPESQLLTASDMQLIFMPLVAFDAGGQRLGMGGGYYDRSLAACSNSSDVATKPLLVATGHDFQFVPMLPHESWDIIPDITITPERIIKSTVRAGT